MNERQAREKGYEFTGAYSRDKEEMKARAKRERDEGNKAVVVNVPPNRLSRGHRGMGYAVYRIESEKNKAFRKAKEKAAKVLTLKRKLAEAEAEVNEIKVELYNLTKED